MHLFEQQENKHILLTLREHSLDYKKFALLAPPSVLDGRPETNLLFLQWLLPRQTLLKRLIPLDVAQRGLKGKAAERSARTIQNDSHNLRRYINLVMLHKGLYLFHKNKDDNCVVLSTTYDDLVQRASNMITSLEPTQHVTDVTQTKLALPI